MKKNVNARKAQPLKLSRETLLTLGKDDLPRIAAGAEEEAFSVKFCTDLCPPTDIS